MRLARRRSSGAAVFAVQARAEDLPFADGSFDSLYSSCAWKHWPDAAAGLAECVRVTRPGGAILVIEIDGASTEDEFRQFARTSRVPVGLREAYVRFAMRTVVGVAPNADALAHSFRGLNTSTPTVSRISGTPFLAAVASAR